MIELELPYPPSANHYWRHVPTRKGRKMFVTVKLSAEGRKFTEDVARVVMASGVKTITGAIAIKLYVYCPDARRRDIDNIRKPLYDALSKAGFWEDDSFIVCDPAFKYKAADGMGRVVVKVQQMDKGVTVAKAGAWLKG